MDEALKRKIRKTARWLIPYPSRNMLRRWFPKFEERNIAFLFAQAQVDVILDVGANVGQFATKMRSCGFAGRIISFEPVSAFHKQLAAAAKGDPLWIVPAPMALGDAAGDMPIKIMGTLSSFLPMAGSDRAATERVPVRRLDDILTAYVPETSARIALKLDVQGYEKAVIEGALASLARVHAMLVEVSLKPIYEGESSYIEMLSWLRDLGFEAAYMSPVVNRNRLGRMFQVDVLLLRSGEAT